MTLNRARALTLIGSSLVLPLAARAHPGHDGHDFTWELSHLAEHPGATFGWVLVLVAAIAAGRWAVRRRQSKSVRAARS